jgi:hypothetical protein
MVRWGALAWAALALGACATPPPPGNENARICQPGPSSSDPHAPIVILCNPNCADRPEVLEGTVQAVLWHRLCDAPTTK